MQKENLKEQLKTAISPVKKMIQQIESIIAPVLKEYDLQLECLEYSKDNVPWITVYIFSPDKEIASADVCEMAGKIDDLVAMAKIIDGAYIIEVKCKRKRG